MQNSVPIGEWYQRLTYTPDTGKLTEADIDKDRENYLKLLDECEAALCANPRLADPAQRQGFNFFPAEPPHFLLSYQHRNNVAIFKRLADVYRQMFPEVCYVAPHVTQRSKGQKPRSHLLRVGFVSGRMAKLSSVMKDRMGVIKHLDRSRFTVALFSFAEPKDNFGQMAKRMVDEYYLCDPQDFIKTRSLIASLNMDVLVYCELGFGPHTYALAHCRLAPVQLTTWGHSDTSGIPTIDHYISTELYEVGDHEEAQSHYSEHLILHKSLCTHYFKPYDEGVAKTMRGRERFFLPQSATLYLLIQTPFKIVNRFLQTVARILKGDPKAILIMTSHPTDHVPGERNYKTLEALLSGDEIARVRMFPWLPYVEAQNLIKVCDVLLDSYPFGGCNTSIESLSVGKPVITMPARFLYGRFTYGFYKAIGVMDLVADSYDAYEALALKVGKDADYRRDISMKILAKASSLFEDKESVQEWNTTLEDLASPYVDRISADVAWVNSLVEFHAMCAPHKVFLWKETLLAFAREETAPSPANPYQVAILDTDLGPEAAFLAKMRQGGFGLANPSPSQRLTIPAGQEGAFPSRCRLFMFKKHKFVFQVNVVDSTFSLAPKPKTNKKSKAKKPSSFWSLTMVNDALLVDKWTPATKWKDVVWASPFLSTSKVRSPLRTVIERWMAERYGPNPGDGHGSKDYQIQGWRYEIQVSPSPTHAFFNLTAVPLYTFIPAMQDVGVKEIKAFLQAISVRGWFMRVYLHATYPVEALSTDLKRSGLKIQWVKTIPASTTVDQCKELVARDRKDHPHLRPFAIVPPFMANAASLFPPSDFDTFVMT